MRQEIIADTEDGDGKRVELIRVVTDETYLVHVEGKEKFSTGDRDEAMKKYLNLSGLDQIGE